MRDLLERYGVPAGPQRDRMMRWVGQGQGQGWWSDYSDVLLTELDDPLVSQNLERYVALEADAGRIETFETTVVHGLLQTEEYARAILTVLAEHTQRAALERLVEVRMKRQRRLYAAQEPLSLRVVLDEAVLYRPVGSDRVMAGQLHRLLEDGQRDNIAIRVLPFHVGGASGCGGFVRAARFPRNPRS